MYTRLFDVNQVSFVSEIIVPTNEQGHIHGAMDCNLGDFSLFLFPKNNDTKGNL